MAAGTEDIIYFAGDMIAMENKNKQRPDSMADMPFCSESKDKKK